jgi:tRNA-Thr(GGU) m(6)t(6)A37 methyltransferase TsaA
MPATWSATPGTALAIATAATAAAAVVIASSLAPSLLMQKKLRRAEERCKHLESQMAKLQSKLKEGSKNQISAGQNSVADKDETHTIVQKKQQPPTIEDETQADGGIFLKRVGTIRSIYRLCVGTPRQGLLCPNARGCIELEKIGDSSSASSVIGLEGFSHMWIIFVFHLNTKSSNPKRIKSKISPPALGGQKVGIYATRSPHRYNPIGITLCKIDRIEKIAKTNHQEERVVIHISGLDLVDGTPVLDIKPFVPTYDSVPIDVKLPSWVEGGLATQRNVVIGQEAQDNLMAILHKNKNALQFYGQRYGERSVQETVDYVVECIRQVLAIDVRSNFQTKKAREGKFQAERAKRLQGASVIGTVDFVTDICTQQLDNLLIQYVVDETSNIIRSSSAGSGAEDTVTVLCIKLLEEG